MEEVGLKVKDLRYYRCQPWGISGNIMMGYWCRLDGDDDTIHLDNFELADGAWVSREELRAELYGQRHRPHLGDDRRICRRQRPLQPGSEKLKQKTSVSVETDVFSMAFR